MRRIISTICAIILLCGALLALHSCVAPNDEVVSIVINSRPTSTPEMNVKTQITLYIGSTDLTRYGYTFFDKYENTNIYAFIDVDGDMQYRALCNVNTFVNGILSKREPKVCVVERSTDGAFRVSNKVVDPNAELFGTPTDLKEPDVTEFVSGYIHVDDTISCYYYVNAEAVEVYRTYAAYPNKDATYWACNENGIIEPGTLPVNLDNDKKQIARAMELLATPTIVPIQSPKPMPTPTIAPTQSLKPTPKPMPTPRYFIGDAPYELIGSVDFTTLININHRLKDNFVPSDMVLVSSKVGSDLVTLDSESTYANSTALQAFCQMLQAAHDDGVDKFYLRNVYRSYDTQVGLWNRRVKSDPLYGRTRDIPLGSAYPGSSEHQTGLAFDITCLSAKEASTRFMYTENYRWLKDNSYKFGFILRYQAAKIEYTGIKFEPYHYRYVGVELATELYSRSMCLEEYYDLPIQWE